MRYFLLVFTVLIVSSCKKEGCTDSEATNFNQFANSEDGSCYYWGYAIFTQSDIVYPATVRLAGQTVKIVDHEPHSKGDLDGPDCYGIYNCTYAYFVGVDGTTHSYTATTDNGDEWSGTVTFTKNKTVYVNLD